MKLNYFFAGALAISMAVTSCSEDLDMSVDESPNLKTRTVMSNDSVENYTIRFVMMECCMMFLAKPMVILSFI